MSQPVVVKCEWSWVRFVGGSRGRVYYTMSNGNVVTQTVSVNEIWYGQSALDNCIGKSLSEALL